jgi:Tol biopolymer transport system component
LKMKSFRFFLIFLLSGVTSRSFAQTYLPIKPTRTISFTTDEGTNMDIDVSPDGKTLVFDLLGDLYTLPVTGGKATQITRGIAINTGPRWSPDGTKIAYWGDTSGSVHVNVINLQRTFHAVLGWDEKELFHSRDTTIVWSPDGKTISIGGALYGLAGGKIQADGNARWPIGYGMDGKTTYLLESEFEPIAGGYLQQKIYKYDRASKEHTAISPVIHRVYQGMLSPDARWWCYYSDSNGRQCLVLTDLLKKETRLAVSQMPVQDPYYLKKGRLTHFAFSPDSKQVFIGYGGKIHRIDVETGNDAIVPFSADVKAGLGPLDYYTYKISDEPKELKYIRSANASPDGKRLVFSALNKIYVMDLPNGKPRILVDRPGNVSQPIYSPNGEWVAYVSWEDSIGGSVWRVPASGGTPDPLTLAVGEYLYPTWSPDGETIAVVKLEHKFYGARLLQYETGKLELISVRTAAVQILDDSVAALNGLAFSADGRRVLYTPRLTNARFLPEPQLVSRALSEGGGTKVIAEGVKMPYYIQKSVSPDGRYLVYSAAEELFLAPINGGGGRVALLQKNQELPAIRFAAGIDPCWEQGGKVLAWTYGNRFYRVNPDKIVALGKKSEEGRIARSENEFYIFNYVSVAVPPDESITIPLSVSQSYAHGTVALTNIRILPMKGGEVIEKGVLVIKDRRILAVGSVSAVKIPVGVKVLDFSGATVMPGLIDLHFHSFASSPTIPQQYCSLQAALAFGTTTFRDPSQHLFSYGYAEAIDAGLMTSPRLYTVGEPAVLPFGMLKVGNLEDFRRTVQKRQRMGSITVKNYLTGSTRLRREWLQIACQEAGLNLTNEGSPDPLNDLAMMKDGNPGIEHNPEWKDVYNDVLTFFARSGTWLTPTLQIRANAFDAAGKWYLNYQYWRNPEGKQKRFSFSDPKQFVSFNGQESIETITDGVPMDTMKKASFLAATSIDACIRHLGGRVTLGSHGNDGGIGPHNELWALQMGGLTNMEALQAGTIMAAEALGLQKDLGSLEVGKIADLIVLNKNPLDDIHNSREIRYVMKDGILYDGDTLDEIWPEKKKCQLWREPGDPAKVRSLPVPAGTAPGRD